MTLVEASEILDVSYSTVYRHLERVAYVQDKESGVITIPRKELSKIREALRQPAQGERKPVMVRVSHEEFDRWQRAIEATTKADADPVPVSRWLAELGNAAAKKAGM